MRVTTCHDCSSGKRIRAVIPLCHPGCDAFPSDLEVVAIHAKRHLLPLLLAIGAPGGALDGDRGAHLPEWLASIQATKAQRDKQAKCLQATTPTSVFSGREQKKKNGGLPALDRDTGVLPAREPRSPQQTTPGERIDTVTPRMTPAGLQLELGSSSLERVLEPGLFASFPSPDQFPGSADSLPTTFRSLREQNLLVRGNQE